MLHGLENLIMTKQVFIRSGFSRDTKKVVKQLLRNAIKAVDSEQLNDAGDLGILAKLLGRIAYATEAGVIADTDFSAFDVDCMNLDLETTLETMPESIQVDWEQLTQAEPIVRGLVAIDYR